MKRTNKIKNKKTGIRLLIKVELIVLVLVVLGLVIQRVGSIPSVKEAIVMATTRKPETFTELYFENHLSLPKNIRVFKKNTFLFTIHNLEYRDMVYRYEVYVNVNGKKQIIDAASVFIKSDGYKTIAEEFTFTLPTKRIKVVVNLVDKNQAIDFWME